MKDQSQKTPAIQPGGTNIQTKPYQVSGPQTDPGTDPNAGIQNTFDPGHIPNSSPMNPNGMVYPATSKPGVTASTTQPSPVTGGPSPDPNTNLTEQNTFGANPATSTSSAPYMSSFMQNYLQQSGAPIPTSGPESPAPAAQFQSPAFSAATPAFGSTPQRTTDIAGNPQGGTSAAPGASPGQSGNEWGNVLSQLDLSKIPGMVGGDALRGMTGDAQNAAYHSATGYLDPQWNNQQHAMETQLANQGVMQNSEAWNKAMDDFNRQKTFAYGQARDAAFNQGLTAQNQLFSQGLQSNQNAFNQASTAGQFTNSAQNQLANQGLTARQIAEQLQAAQTAANAQVSSASIGANASTSNVQAQLAAAERQNHFNNDLTLRNQGINELLLQQNNPINVANALNQGTNVTQPNFTTTPNANVNGTDLASLINQAYQGQLTGYNAQTGNANSNNAAMASILAAIICDRRLKTNVRRIGMHAAGFPLYTFDYLWGEPGIGPMADEVREVLPHAVIDMGGFDAVNMALLEAA